MRLPLMDSDAGKAALEDALAALDAGVAALHGAFLRLAEEDAGPILFEAYRRLSDKELEVYVAFLETEEAHAVHAAVLAAVKRVFITRQHTLADDFFASLRRNKN